MSLLFVDEYNPRGAIYMLRDRPERIGQNKGIILLGKGARNFAEILSLPSRCKFWANCHSQLCCVAKCVSISEVFRDSARKVITTKIESLDFKGVGSDFSEQNNLK